jgi:ABC-type glycerol-3-phosphate transport system substrate-binding protein
MKFNHRAWLSVVASLCIAALILSSCGDLTPDSLAFATDDEDTSTESVIRIAATRVAGLERAIDDWEREHPTARVEVVVRSVDDHHVSVLDDAGAGGTFDIIAFDASYGPEIRQRPELFVDLRDLGGESAEADLLEARWNEGIAAGGELIGLPIDVDSVALAVRTDLVGEELVEQLRSATTWCQLIAVGDAFSDASSIAFLPVGD